MSIRAICIFKGKQLLSACRRTAGVRPLTCWRAMRRPQVYIGITLVLLGFWVGSLITRLEDDSALGYRSVDVVEFDDDEFDTKQEAIWGPGGSEDADEGGLKWREVQKQVETALTDIEGEVMAQKEPFSKETLRVEYSPMMEKQTETSLPKMDISTPVTYREEEEELEAEGEESDQEDSYDFEADDTLDIEAEEPDDPPGYDGRFENPTLDMIQPFTDVEGMDSKLNDFKLESPIKFLPNYRNPCWYEPVNSSTPLYKYNLYTWLYPGRPHERMFKRDFDAMRNILKERSRSSGTEETWRIRCLPYFYLIGMPRSGSTDLTYSIGFHPYVIKSRLKEFKYWNRARLQHPARKLMVVKQPWYRNMMTGKIPYEKGAVQLRNYPHELRHYVETFDYMGEISRNFTKGFTRQEYPYHPMILGDESPSYMFDFDAWEQLDVHKGLSEPRFTTAHYIKQLTPRAKFIITLRNPADRLFSDYKAFYTTQHKTARDFDELVRVNINLFNNCTKTRTVRACAYSYNSTLPFQPVRPRVGIYYIYLVDWFATYPRDQFYITRLEDFAEKKSAVASEIFEFLELPPVSDDILFEIDKDTVHNTAVQRSGKGTTVGELLMWDSTKKIIQDFYRPWNDKLVQLLGDDKYSFS